MSDSFLLFQKFLKLERRPDRINFYTILGLEEFSADPDVIIEAFRSAESLLRQADRESNPKGFAQVVQSLKQAKAVLTNSQLKQKYDSQLKLALQKQMAFEKGPQGTENSGIDQPETSSQSDLASEGRLAQLLPAADPYEAFNVELYLNQSGDIVPATHPPETSADHLRIQLQQAFLHGIDSIQTPSAIAPSKVVESKGPGIGSYFPDLNADSRQGKARTAQSPQVVLRKNRQSRNLFAGLIALSISITLLLLVTLYYLSNRSKPSPNRLELAISEPSGNSAPIDAFESSDSTSPSDESDPTGVPTPTATPNRNRNDRDQASRPERRPPMSVGRRNAPDPTAPLGPLPSLGESVDEDENDDENKNSLNVDQDEPTPSEPSEMKVDVTSKMSNDNLAEEVNKRWTQAILAAREALFDQELDEFKRRLAQAKSIPATAEQEAKLQRLDTLGQVYEMGQKLFKENFSKLQALDTIKVGRNSEVVIVEVSSDSIVIRISGSNRRFLKNEIPFGIALALLEQNTDEGGLDQAMLGAFCRLDVRATPESIRRSTSYFEAAAQQDNRFADLELAFEEEY